MAREPGQYQYGAPDDRTWRRNSCRGHEREIVAACDPTRSIRPFLSRPRGGRMPRHMNMDNLPAGVIDHEEHVQHSERDRWMQKKSQAQISEPCCLRNDRQREDGPRRWVRCIYLATVLAESLNPSLASSAWILR